MKLHANGELILQLSPHLLAFPYFWQVPAATERAAYESLSTPRAEVRFEYVGLPWATLIDGLRGDGASTWPILMAVEQLCNAPRKAWRRATVAQHIHALKFIDFFAACGITDLFWSHAIHGEDEVSGIRIHPFPLFPAQAPSVVDLPLDRPRKYLANFIGAYNPSLY
jgi:hypothetical protein